MKLFIFIILFSLIKGQNQPTEIQCAEGCNGTCLTDYTCQDCKDEYEDDGSCMTCRWVDPYDNQTDYIVKKGYTCKRVENINENPDSYLFDNVDD